MQNYQFSRGIHPRTPVLEEKKFVFVLRKCSKRARQNSKIFPGVIYPRTPDNFGGRKEGEQPSCTPIVWYGKTSKFFHHSIEWRTVSKASEKSKFYQVYKSPTVGKE